MGKRKWVRVVESKRYGRPDHCGKGDSLGNDLARAFMSLQPFKQHPHHHHSMDRLSLPLLYILVVLAYLVAVVVPIMGCYFPLSKSHDSLLRVDVKSKSATL